MLEIFKKGNFKTVLILRHKKRPPDGSLKNSLKSEYLTGLIRGILIKRCIKKNAYI